MYDNNTSSPTTNLKLQNVLRTSIGGTPISATKLTNFGEGSTSPISPYKSRNTPGSASKGSIKELESEIQGHIESLKNIKTDLNKSQKTPTATAGNIYPESYLRYQETKTQSPGSFTTSTYVNPVEKSDWLRKSTEIASRTNYGLKSSPSNLERSPYESSTVKPYEAVYNRIVGNRTPEHLAKEKSPYSYTRPYDSAQKLQSGISNVDSFSYLAQGSMGTGTTPVNVNRSYDFNSRNFNAEMIRTPPVNMSVNRSQEFNSRTVPITTETISVRHLLQSQSQPEGIQSAGLTRVSEPITGIDNKRIYSVYGTTPGTTAGGYESSQSYDALQKEISNRYERTKDMLDSVFTRNKTPERTDSPTYYERYAGVPSLSEESRGRVDEKPRNAAVFSPEERVQEVNFQREKQEQMDQPKKQRAAARYIDNEEEEGGQQEQARIKEQDQNRIKEYQNIIEDLQKRIIGLENEREQEKERKQRIQVETLERPEEERVKRAGFSGQGEDLIQKVQEMASRIEALESENGDLKTTLKNNENKERLNQNFLKKNEDEREKLELENVRLQDLLKEASAKTAESERLLNERERGASEQSLLNIELDRVKRELDGKINMIRVLEGENDQFKHTIHTLDEDLKTLKDAQNKTSLKEIDLGQKIWNLESELTDARKRLETFQEKERAHQQVVEKVGQQENHLKESQTKISGLNQRIEELVSHQKGLEEKARELDHAKVLVSPVAGNVTSANFTSQLEGLMEQNQSLKTLLQREKENESSLILKSQQESQALADKVRQIEEALSGKELLIQALQGQLDAKENERKHQANESSQTIQKLNDEKSSLQTQIHDLNMSKINLESKIHQLTQRETETTDSRIKQLEDEVAHHKSREIVDQMKIDNLTQINGNLALEVQQIHQRVVQHENEITSLKLEKDRLQISLDSNQTTYEHEKLKSQTTINELMATIKDLEKTISRHQETAKENIQGNDQEKSLLESKLKSALTEKEETLEQLRDYQRSAVENKNLILRLTKEKEELDGEVTLGRVQRGQLEARLADVQKDLSTEIEKLQKQERGTQGELGGRIGELESSLRTIKEQNSQLQQEVEKQKNLRKTELEKLEKENKSLKSANQSEIEKKDKLVKELEKKVQGAVKERDEQTRKVEEIKQESKNKEEQIKGLKFDVSQMKNYIEQLQGESESREEQKSELTSEFPLPTPEMSFSQDISLKEGSEWAGLEKSKKASPIVPEQRKNKKRGKVHVEGYTEIIIDTPHGYKLEKIKSKKDIENNPIHMRYERIIKDLTDKLTESRAKFQREVEVQALETSKHHVEREQQLLDEIEALKKDKEALNKKIEDIEWDKAYEYTQKKAKGETKLEPQVSTIVQEKSAAAPQASTDAENKKKKKKKKAKTQDKKDEGEWIKV